MDSLRRQAALCEVDTTCSRIYYELGMTLSVNEMESAMIFCRACMEHAKRAKDYFWQAKGLACIAACIYYQDDYKGAIQYFDSALRVLHLHRLTASRISSEATKFQIFLLRNLAMFYVMNDQLADWECYYNISYEEAKASYDTNGMAIALEGIGNIHYSRLNLLAALDYYQQSLALIRAIGGDETSVLSAIANAHN